MNLQAIRRTRAIAGTTGAGLAAALLLLLAACVSTNPTGSAAARAETPTPRAEQPSSPPTPTATAAPASEAASAPTDTASFTTPVTGPPTTVIEYAPQLPAGEARAGSCWTNSVAVPSRTAWRCNVGNQVLDPCFAITPIEVVCTPNPLTGSPGDPVKLAEPLPRPDVIVEDASSPWLLQLDDGTVCNLAVGASGVVDGKRIAYVCGAPGADDNTRVVILGNVQPGTTWTADRAKLSLSNGKLVVVGSSTVPVRTVVRGPSAFVPLDCAPIADALATILGANARRSEAPFVDPSTGQRGTGCQLTATGPGVNLVLAPAELVGSMLVAQGWQEDQRYRSVILGRSDSVFRKGSALCLVSSGDAIALNCARDRSAPDNATASPPAPEPIFFEADATEGSLRRPIAPGEIQEYVLRALAGQAMLLDLTSPGSGVFFTLSGQGDGARLVEPDAGATHWRGILRATQDYRIRIASRGPATEFELRVVIPATLQVRSDGRSTVVKGTLGPNQRLDYVVTGATDRGLAVAIASPNRNVFLTVSGLQDGQALVSPAVRTTDWAGRLPRPDDYVLQVVSDGAPSDYTLTVTGQ